MSVKFTERAEKVLLAAGEEAKNRAHDFVGTEHVLHAIVSQSDSIAMKALYRANSDTDRLQQLVGEALEKIEVKGSQGSIPFTPHAKRCLHLASDEAVRCGHSFISTEHLLLGVLREEEGAAARLLQEVGVQAEDVENIIVAMLGGGEEPNPNPQQKY